MSVYGKDKQKLFNLICKNNIGINSEGKFIFKSELKRNVSKYLISEEDALNILLKLLFLARMGKMNYGDLSSYEFNLIKEIKNINKLPNKSKNQIFNRSYHEERLIVNDYINKLIRQNNINNPHSNSLNQRFIGLHGNSFKKATRKIGFDRFDKDELYYILDLNPQLSFQNEKVLKNMIVSEFKHHSLDLDLLNNSPKEKLRKVLINARKEEESKKVKDEEFKDIFNKIKSFNRLPIEKAIVLIKEHEKIYEKITGNYFDIPNTSKPEIYKFKTTYENVDKITSLIQIKNQISPFIDEMSDIIKENVYFNHDVINEVLNKYGQQFNVISMLNDFSKSFKNNYYLQFKEIFKIEKLYNDLKDYTDISNSRNDNLIRIHNERYLDREINKNRDFFEDISDMAKKRAIVLDTENIKVVAGAGTGKTFIIQNKVKYLIEKKNVAPDEILCLCYTRKGANQLDEKVNNSDDLNKVGVYTFHGFAREVDNACGGNKTTNRYLLNQIIRKYIENVDNKQLDDLIEYFGYYMAPPEEVEKIEKELEEYESGVEIPTLKRKYFQRGKDKITMQGEYVKSIEELIISNYLFMHDIEYEYEKEYQLDYYLDLLDNFRYSGNFFSLGRISHIQNERIFELCYDNHERWTRHTPDFYLTDYDIYLEHFGVDRNMEAKWLTGDEKVKYENEMHSKEFWHDMYGSKLIKTYSFYKTEGRLLEELEKILKENGVTIGQIDKKEILDVLSKISYYDDFKNFYTLIKTFIDLFEAKHLPKDEFKKFKKQNYSVVDNYTRKRQQLFLDIVEDIYTQYYLHNQGNEIDHNREISNALELIKSGKYKDKFSYILIDEYQDINDVRCELIQELQKNTNAKLFVVGDDWQSIYAFNGSNLKLFLDFDRYFKNPEIIKLEESRRCPQKINEITRKLIFKNHNQEDKCLKDYYNNLNKDPIKLVTYSSDKRNKNRILKLEAIINDIAKNNHKKDLKILLLSRINDDIDKFIYYDLFKTKKYKKSTKVIYLKKPELDITFMSIHQSKGLECDEVVILNFEDEKFGFPIQITDDSILDFVKTKDYPYEEERRLLYVALTRTRNNVYLLSPRTNYSIFIDNLINEFDLKETHLRVSRNSFGHYSYRDYVEEYVPTKLTCPECGNAKIAIVYRNYKSGKNTKFVRCMNNCGYNGGTYPARYEDIKYVEKCPSCRGILVRKGNILKCCLNFHEGCLETKELELDSEDLEDEL